MNAAQFSSALGKVNDRYIMEAITYERKKKRSWLKWGTTTACIAACICLVVGAALWIIKLSPFDGPVLSFPIATPSDQTEIIQSNNPDTEVIQSNVPNTKDIQINEISYDYFSLQSIFFLGGFEEMTRDEVLSHFGISLDLSTVMPNMQEVEDTCYGFYYTGNGDLFYQFTFRYIDVETHQTMNITLRNGGLPITQIKETYKHELQSSELCEREVVIAHYTDRMGISTYYAEFPDRDFGLMITAGDCPVDDFIRTLEYLAQL